ncbi:PAP2 family protein [Shewanella violacea DSS12]|uniref:undecaprenyl-diphosphate phosphatase n=2 Tax=Shewanella violacea TaxID=60217 RepID=D4ZEC3_SHEVD|nr:PAP2 family protein [Shewanella violacea DSS12]
MRYKAQSRQLTGYGFQILLLALFVVHILTLNDATNLSLFNLINGIGTQLPAWLVSAITDLGNGTTLGAIVLCYLIKRPELTLRVVVAAILSLLMVPLIKDYFASPRPAVILEYLNIIGETRHVNSFPSGHTATAFLFAVTVFLVSKCNKIKLGLISVAALIGVSRIMVGAHWPADVVMGAIVGALCAYGALLLTPLVRFSDKYRLFSYLALLAVLLLCELDKGIDADAFWQVIMFRWIWFSVCTGLIWQFWKRSHGVTNLAC